MYYANPLKMSSTLEYLKSDRGIEFIRDSTMDLPSREKVIIWAISNIDNVGCKTQSQIAREQNCSRQNIHKIKNRAVRKLRKHFISNGFNV